MEFSGFTMLHVKNVQVLSCNSFLLGIDAISFPNDMLLLQYELSSQKVFSGSESRKAPPYGETH